MIPTQYASGGRKTAIPGAFYSSGVVPGNTLASGYWNWILYHLTTELNAVLTAAGVTQNSSTDNQLLTSIQNLIAAARTESYTPSAGYTPAVGDVAELNYDGTIRKASRGAKATLASGSAVTQIRIAKLDATHFVVAYCVGLNLLAQVWVVNIATGVPSSVAAAQSIFTFTTTAGCFEVVPIDGTDVLIGYQTTGGGYNQGYVRSLTCNVSTGAITVNGAVSCSATTGCLGLYPIPGTSYFLMMWLASSTIYAASVISGGTSPVFNTPATSGAITAQSNPTQTPLSMTVDDSGTLGFAMSIASGSPFHHFVLGTTIASLVVSPGGAGITDTGIVTSSYTGFVEATADGGAYFPDTFFMLLYDSTRLLWGFANFVAATVVNLSQVAFHDLIGGGAIKVIDRQGGVFAVVGPWALTPGSSVVQFNMMVFKRSGGKISMVSQFNFGDSFQVLTAFASSIVGASGLESLSSGFIIAGLATNSASGLQSQIMTMRRRNQILGVAVDAIGTVQRSGPVSGLSGLTVGPVGVDDNGNLTSIVGEARIGQALSATVLDLQIIPGI